MSSRFVASQPHKDLLDPDYRTWLAFLSESDGWSRERMRDHQLAEVNRVLALAARTPGYLAKWKEADGVPEALASLDDLRRVPLISKEEIRDNLADFTLTTEGMSYVTTGGSTGIPFGMYRSHKAFARELASKAHQYHRIGWKEGDPQVVFRGLPITNDTGFEYFPEFNELRLSSYHLVPERMEQYAQLFEDYRPDWIRCYPSSGQIFANWLLDTGRTLPPVKGMLCASENLYGFQLELFRRAFGGRTFSHYGHYELCVLAGFCETQDTYHVMPQYGYAELLDPDGEPVREVGQVGEIVGTSFLMDGTIFVRYRTNDYAVFGGTGCPHCGRQHDIWQRIEGRLQDFIVTATGRLISMTAVNMHDDIFDRLSQFQFEQHERGTVLFKYIPRDKALSGLEIDEIRNRLRPKLGSDITVTFEQVANIEITKRGKHRFLIQHLPLAMGDGARNTLFSAET